MSKTQTTQIRNIAILVLFLLGIILSTMSLGAELIGLDLTPGFGIVQMLQLLLGISFLTLAAFMYLKQSRPANAPRSLQADYRCPPGGYWASFCLRGRVVGFNRDWNARAAIG
ncbi:MAG: hypothetical protein P8183_02495 [Anaerolineae bacterium]